MRLPMFLLNAVPAEKMRPTTLRHRCMLCQQPYPIQPSTQQTIEEIRARKQLYVVVCKDCLPLIAGVHENATTVVGGTNALRGTLGLGEAS